MLDHARLSQVATLARQLMNTHMGDSARTWTFQYDRAKRRAGRCYYHQRVITLSRYIAGNPANSIEFITDTILHEMAHAIAYKATGEAGHGYAWKQVCKQIGAKPERCYNSDEEGLVLPHGRYIGVCNSCQKTVVEYHRKPKANRTVYHIACGRESVVTFSRRCR